MKRIKALVAAADVAALTACASTGGGGVVAEDKVVYHFNEGLVQATNGIRNINNHLEVNPKAKIVVVSHADVIKAIVAAYAGMPFDLFQRLVKMVVTRDERFLVTAVQLCYLMTRKHINPL